jgi:5-methylcytosine-specific restriction endonuclease McrA
MRDGKRDFQAELDWEKDNKPSRVKERSKRNAARAMMMEEGRVRKGDDVDHKKPLSKGGGNGRSNLRVVAASKNRSVKRKQDGSLR